MDFKDLDPFLRYIQKLPLDQPCTLCISGLDVEIGRIVIHQLRERLEKEIREYELLVFSNEPGEELSLHTELANPPLFASYRFLIVRQAEEILGHIHSSKQSQDFANSVKNLADRTLLLLLYSGSPPQRFLKIFGEHFSHLVTRKLYPNQIEEVCRKSIAKRKLKLTPNAFSFLLENLEPKTSVIEHCLNQLQTLIKPKSGLEIEAEEVASILFPSEGWNAFALIDSLFSGNLKAALREYKRFQSNSDHLFLILKLILRRADEIRLANIAYSQQMSEKEMISFLGLASRPPFIQKKIIERLRYEVPTFPIQKLLEVYDFLIEMQKSFRSQTPPERQLLLFQTKSLELFFPS